MRGVFEPPIDRGAVPVTQRSPCRPSLSLSIADSPPAPGPLSATLTDSILLLLTWKSPPQYRSCRGRLARLADLTVKDAILIINLLSENQKPNGLISHCHLFHSCFSPYFSFCLSFFSCVNFKYFVGLTILYMILPQHQSKKQQQNKWPKARCQYNCNYILFVILFVNICIFCCIYNTCYLWNTVM